MYYYKYSTKRGTTILKATDSYRARDMFENSTGKTVYLKEIEMITQGEAYTTMLNYFDEDYVVDRIKTDEEGFLVIPELTPKKAIK